MFLRENPNAWSLKPKKSQAIKWSARHGDIDFQRLTAAISYLMITLLLVGQWMCPGFTPFKIYIYGAASFHKRVSDDLCLPGCHLLVWVSLWCGVCVLTVGLL